MKNLSLHKLSLNSSGSDGILLCDFLQLRHDIFVEKLSWELTTIGGLEVEEYDTEDAIFIVAVDNETQKVVGGARLLRTDHEMSACAFSDETVTYMIKDAFEGKLDGIPAQITLEQPPTSKAIWELTRLISTGGAVVVEAILFEAQRILKTKMATECLFLGPPSFMRMARKMGFQPKPLGPVVEEQSGKYLAFSCNVLGD